MWVHSSLAWAMQIIIYSAKNSKRSSNITAVVLVTHHSHLIHFLEALSSKLWLNSPRGLHFHKGHTPHKRGPHSCQKLSRVSRSQPPRRLRTRILTFRSIVQKWKRAPGEPGNLTSTSNPAESSRLRVSRLPRRLHFSYVAHNKENNLTSPAIKALHDVTRRQPSRACVSTRVAGSTLNEQWENSHNPPKRMMIKRKHLSLACDTVTQ